MKVLDPGHVYILDHRGEGSTKIHFVDMEPGHEFKSGVITQEVLRMLIDRTHYCNNCLPHPNNERIIRHLRMALVLHEARALERKVEKGELAAEQVEVDHDGHYKLDGKGLDPNSTRYLKPWSPDQSQECDYSRRADSTQKSD